jgi:hypothetical protein
MPREQSAILHIGEEKPPAANKDAKAALKAQLKANASRLAKAKQELEAAQQEGIELRNQLDQL